MQKTSVSTLLPVSILFLASLISVEANAQNNKATAQILAVQIIKQGHRCDEPQSAEKQKKLSSPNSRVWVLKCKEATYRVTLKPKRAAVIEVIKQRNKSKDNSK